MSKGARVALSPRLTSHHSVLFSEFFDDPILSKAVILCEVIDKVVWQKATQENIE